MSRIFAASSANGNFSKSLGLVLTTDVAVWKKREFQSSAVFAQSRLGMPIVSRSAASSGVMRRLLASWTTQFASTTENVLAPLLTTRLRSSGSLSSVSGK